MMTQAFYAVILVSLKYIIDILKIKYDDTGILCCYRRVIKIHLIIDILKIKYDDTGIQRIGIFPHF